ncbi:MAG: tRNA lysidine(34) synthetase TilS [Clostridiales bacterium]|jgi:tRNA(Ile)-lysidine synthase|nr:tRNA lysidine(34) synthetase TilS [Clostridiales bacterium]
MKNKVLQTIKTYNMFPPGEKVLLAVSGGPDSLCLLHVMHDIAAALNITLHVIHINHRLRPESASEALFVKKQGCKLGVPVTVCSVDVRGLKQKGGYSVQDAARRARYAVIRITARRVGATRVATAHHRDDRVETLLLRMLHGSGLDGLAGIPVERKMADTLTVARPFFAVSRDEIEEYCRIHKLKPVMDPSNEEYDHYLRNRVRLHLLPFLEKEFGGHVRTSLAKSADLLIMDRELLHRFVRDIYHDVASSNHDGEVNLDVMKLLRLSPALQLRLLRMSMWSSGIERASVVHAKQLLSLARNPSPSARISLPGGITAVRRYSELRLSRVAHDNHSLSFNPVELSVPGRTVLPGSAVIEAQIISRRDVTLPLTDRNQAYLDWALLERPLCVRPRLPGDRMEPLGCGGTRKVKDILIDKKVPLAQRNSVPLVLSGKHVAWLGGVEIAHPFRVTAATEEVLHLKLHQKTEKDGDYDR